MTPRISDTVGGIIQRNGFVVESERKAFGRSAEILLAVVYRFVNTSKKKKTAKRFSTLILHFAFCILKGLCVNSWGK